MLNQAARLDGRPTMREWPVRIGNMEEVKPQFAEPVRLWIKEAFAACDFVYAPKRQTNSASYTYMFGYGQDEIFFMREEFKSPVIISRQRITEVMTERELLNANIMVRYQENGSEKSLEFPYVPSVYYLYDPFLNWLLGLPKIFAPILAERENPRPQRLYEDSLVMFNYSIGAYRLGDKISDYNYRSQQHRCKWMPWKKNMEEWLEIPMERGVFKLHTFRYLTECRYCLQ